MALNYPRIYNAARRWMLRTRNDLRIRRVAIQVARHAPEPKTKPVIFFNASTRLSGLSLNGAFSLLTSWGLRLRGIPVHHFVCASGMTRCIHGTRRDDPQHLPPCQECIHQSRVNYQAADVTWFSYRSDPELEQVLKGLSVEEMMDFSWEGIPLGALVLPSLRWVLRRYHLQTDADTHFFFCQYLLSAWSVAQSFGEALQKLAPQAVVVFNGMVYPEAVARWLARREGIRVITHEVNMLPYTAYFTDQEATFRTVETGPDFDLDESQSAHLDAYLEERFQGKFNMAGVSFWKEMRGLGKELEEKINGFKQVVPVFTNVIFDTTQEHANIVFEHMFDWLNTILNIIRGHPETLFIIRAHPDECRPGKFSLESVADWVKTNQVDQLKNVVFIPPDEYVSSYALIQKAKFTLVYSSTIGLEAVLMGAPVLCGGNSRYNQIPTAFFEATPAAFCGKVEQFLEADSVNLPVDYIRNARRFLYAELFFYGLSFDDLLEEDGIWQGYVRLKSITWRDLLTENSKTMQIIVDGIVNQKPFRIP